jgi:hypothetical protein
MAINPARPVHTPPGTPGYSKNNAYREEANAGGIDVGQVLRAQFSQVTLKSGYAEKIVGRKLSTTY